MPTSTTAKQESSWTASAATIDAFYENVEYLWAADFPVYSALPSPLEFYRNHVARSRPCLIRHRAHAPPRLTWDDIQAAWPDDNLPLWVDVTPDGHGDCLRQVTTATDVNTGKEVKKSIQQFFVKPMECQMTLAEFLQAVLSARQQQHQAQSTQQQQEQSPSAPQEHDTTVSNRVFETTTTTTTVTSLEASRRQEAPATTRPPPVHQGVFYYSRQNDCLRTDLQPLWENTIGERMQWLTTWASTVFGHDAPEAVNLWMGPATAVSAMHKDPYENLFHVTQGTKVFTLVPPAYVPLLHERPVPSGRFVWDEAVQQWKVQVDQATDDGDGEVETVPWITTNVLDPSSSNTIPYRTVCVEAGETLYLPSLWFHRVAQQGADLTIGINAWYDMQFASPLWAYFDLLQRMQVNEHGQDGETEATSRE